MKRIFEWIYWLICTIVHFPVNLFRLIKSFFIYQGVMLISQDNTIRYYLISEYDLKFLYTAYAYYRTPSYDVKILGFHKYRWKIDDKSLILTKKDFENGFKHFPKEESRKFLNDLNHRIGLFD